MYSNYSFFLWDIKYIWFFVYAEIKVYNYVENMLFMVPTKFIVESGFNML